jgi:plasmid stabilization system protein ParE
MIHLVVTPRAKRDRDEILRYLVKEAGVAVARKFAERFHDSISRLIEMPAYGAPRPELGAECRIIVITPYVLLYEHDLGRDQITVLRILHGRRGITEKLLRR